MRAALLLAAAILGGCVVEVSEPGDASSGGAGGDGGAGNESASTGHPVAACPLAACHDPGVCPADTSCLVYDGQAGGWCVEREAWRHCSSGCPAGTACATANGQRVCVAGTDTLCSEGL